MFPQRLREARKAKDLTLEQLADLYNERFNDVGLNKGTLSKYENDTQKPLAKTVSGLAEILDESTDYLLGKSDCSKSKMAEWDRIHNPVKDVRDYESFISNILQILGGGGRNSVQYDNESMYNLLKILQGEQAQTFFDFVDFYSKLNSTGKVEAVKRIQELSCLPEYSAVQDISTGSISVKD